ncbi:MAG: FtsX-like permease family protein [Prevotella sp.]
MSFPFYIARHYLFSKKSTNAINVISAISVIGVAVATMAMVIVLSVFNGFQDLVASFFTNIDPQLKVVPVMGKTAPADDPILTKIKANANVAVATECVEDQALAIYHGRQSMVTVMGVEDNFRQLTDFDQVLRGDDDFMLHAANLQYGILGVRLAQNLDMGYDWDGFLSLYAPMREGQYDPMVSPGFVVDSVMSPGVLFNVMQGRYDKGYIIVSIEMARNLFGQQGRLSSLQLRLKPGCNVGSAKKQLAQLAQGRYKVLDRYEQQADTFKIMNIEKLMAYLFLTFILVVACFNIISSLLMLIIDKKNDVVTLRNMGATNHQITQIFLFEGRLISLMGALLGIGIGLLLCGLQQQFGLVSLGGSAGTYIVDAYPVSVHYIDVLFIFLTVIAVGWLSSWYPVRYMSKRLLSAA